MVPIKKTTIIVKQLLSCNDLKFDWNVTVIQNLIYLWMFSCICIIIVILLFHYIIQLFMFS